MRYLIMARYLILLIFVPPLLLGLAGALFTFNKLERMKQIRGVKPGATPKMQAVLEKWESDRACWIRIADGDIRRHGPHRLNLESEEWDKLELGEPIEVMYLPDDATPYLRNGIYASDGNLEFDGGLLVMEIVVSVVSLLGGLITFGILIVAGGKLRRLAGVQVAHAK